MCQAPFFLGAKAEVGMPCCTQYGATGVYRVRRTRYYFEKTFDLINKIIYFLFFCIIPIFLPPKKINA